MVEARPRKKLNALDRSFLAAERRDATMHVGVLLELSPPPGATAADLSRALRDELARSATAGAAEPWAVRAPWNLRLTHPEILASPLQAWEPDDHFDLEYHVRRSALASPGDERELGILVSRLHSAQLDFHRPPWEVHFIEGLAGGRMAIYVKVHHALVDGYAGMGILARSFSEDPADRSTPLFFTRDDEPGPMVPGEERVPTLGVLLDLARDQVSVAKDIGRALVNVVKDRSATDRVLALTAPSSALNQKITRSRRFATLGIELSRIEKVAAEAGGTLNDVVLGLVGHGLRRFLLEQDALPEKPLVAMMPVNVQPQGETGLAPGAILASLATDDDDPRIGLQKIIDSTKRARAQLAGMSRSAIVQYSALVLAPMMLAFVPGLAGRFRPAFNVVISSLPGPPRPLYFRGWRVDEMYPVSIPFHGYGLNVTVQTYAERLHFGFTGCRDTLPHLQRLAVYAGEAMQILEGSGTFRTR